MENREKYRKMVLATIQKYRRSALLGPEMQKEIARKIERSYNNAAIRLAEQLSVPPFWTHPGFVEQYHLIGYRVGINLDPASPIKNHHLINAIIDYYYITVLRKYITQAALKRRWKNVRPEVARQILYYICHFPKIDPNKLGYMRSEELYPAHSEQIRHSIEKRMNQKIKRRVSAMYKCPNCEKRKTTFYQKQTRALDEPATLFITCAFCDHEWTRG